LGSIQGGFQVLVGFTYGDTKATCLALAKKLVALRVFPQLDQNGKTVKEWDWNVVQSRFKILLVSQFTLFAKLKGSKPDFHNAMPPTEARELYYYFVQMVRAEYHALAKKIQTHPANSLKTKQPPDAFDYTTVDPLIESHLVAQNALPGDQQHHCGSSISDVKGLEFFDFDEFVQSTQFGSYMSVHIVNDGPFTLILESVPDVVKIVKDNTRYEEGKGEKGEKGEKAVVNETKVEIDVTIEATQPLADDTIEAISTALE
jgi:D-tyrosyl-tRNA(Tyr) deacylase